MRDDKIRYELWAQEWNDEAGRDHGIYVESPYLPRVGDKIFIDADNDGRS